jgi:hypothetical protein
MVESKKIRVSNEDALAMEAALAERKLLGRVFLLETKMVDPKIEEFLVRISSVAPLSPNEAQELRNELLQKAGDLLGDGLDSKKVFIKPLSGKAKRTRMELSL